MQSVRQLGLFRIAVLLAVLIIAAVGFIQAVHVHAAQADSLHCSVCVVAHASAAPVSFLHVHLLVRAPDRVLQLESRTRSAPFLTSIFIRPPPTA